MGNSGTLGYGAVTDNSVLAFSRSDTAPGLIVANAISGSGSLYKSGTGTLVLAGNNSYSGATTLYAGKLALDSTSGYAVGGNVNLVNNNPSAGSEVLYMLQNNQFAPGSVLRWVSNVADHARVELLGTTQTVAGIDNTATSGVGVVQNYEQAPVSSDGASTLVINGTGSYTFNGYLRSQNGTLGLTMAAGSQTLMGGNITCSGATSIGGGTLSLQDTTAFGSAVSVGPGGTLNLVRTSAGFANRSAIAASAITGSGVIDVNSTTSGIGGGWVIMNGATAPEFHGNDQHQFRCSGHRQRRRRARFGHR